MLSYLKSTPKSGIKTQGYKDMAKKPLTDISIHLSAFPLSNSPELEMGQICSG